MTVWLVNVFWDLPQEGNRAQRYSLMAEAFARAGHEVVYFTSDFSHATKEKRVLKNVDVKDHQFVDGNIRVVLLPTKPYKKNICLSRVISHKLLAKTFRSFAEKEIEKPSLIVACTPTLGLCDNALSLAKKYDAKFICDIQDAWPETFERILPRFLLAPLRKVAKRIYCGADAIASTGLEYAKLAKSYGSLAISYPLTQVIAPRESSRVPRELKNEKNLRLVYCGNMSKSYDIKTLIEAVKELPDVTLDLAGNGPDRPILEKLAQSCNRIKFHGYLGEKELAMLLDSADIGVIPMLSESCVAIPGKMADYSASRLRIIECLGGECEMLGNELGVSVHYQAKNVESLKEAILKAKMLNPKFDEFKNYFDGFVVMNNFVEFATKLVVSS